MHCNKIITSLGLSATLSFATGREDRATEPQVLQPNVQNAALTLSPPTLQHESILKLTEQVDCYWIDLSAKGHRVNASSIGFPAREEYEALGIPSPEIQVQLCYLEDYILNITKQPLGTLSNGLSLPWSSIRGIRYFAEGSVIYRLASAYGPEYDLLLADNGKTPTIISVGSDGMPVLIDQYSEVEATLSNFTSQNSIRQAKNGALDKIIKGELSNGLSLESAPIDSSENLSGFRLTFFDCGIGYHWAMLVFDSGNGHPFVLKSDGEGGRFEMRTKLTYAFGTGSAYGEVEYPIWLPFAFREHPDFGNPIQSNR